MEADGEALSFAELELPTDRTMPEEENFCAVPWLRGESDGAASAKTEEMLRQFKVFDDEPERKEDDEGGQVTLVADPQRYLEVWANHLAEQNPDRFGDEDETLVPVSDNAKAINAEKFSNLKTAAARVLETLHEKPEIWTDLESALDRPHAYLLPHFGSEVFLTQVNSWDRTLSHDTSLLAAVRMRMLGAHASGDHGTAVPSLRVGARLLEAFGNDSISSSEWAASHQWRLFLDGVTHGLWSDDWVEDAEALQICQAALEALSLKDTVHRNLRTRQVLVAEFLGRVKAERKRFDPEMNDHLSGNERAVLNYAPQGWFLSNAAYGIDLVNRTQLAAIRRRAPMGELLEERNMAEADLVGLSELQRMNFALTVLFYQYGGDLLVELIALEARRRQAVIAFALYRYRLDHDQKFPATLAALVPDFLAEIPADHTFRTS